MISELLSAVRKTLTAVRFVIDAVAHVSYTGETCEILWMGESLDRPCPRCAEL